MYVHTHIYWHTGTDIHTHTRVHLHTYTYRVVVVFIVAVVAAAAAAAAAARRRRRLLAINSLALAIHSSFQLRGARVPCQFMKIRPRFINSPACRESITPVCPQTDARAR